MTDIVHLVNKYLQNYETEKNELERLLAYLESTRDHSPQIDRKNMRGHITGSGLIVNKDLSCVLMIQHQTLGKRLPPGGHVDKEDGSVLAAVYREIQEETGIDSSSLSLISCSMSDEVPIDINTHAIEKSTAKQEDFHYHHDFRFLFLYTGDFEFPRPSPEDGSQIEWVPISTAFQDASHLNLPTKLRHALSTEFRTKLFYDALLKNLQSKNNIRSIVVSHIIPDCVYYLRAVNKSFPIDAVIPKPNSIVQDIRKKVECDFQVVDITREQLKQTENEIVELIRNHTDDVILFDIGGYFVGVSNWPEDIKKRIRLIVEDTENGHQKYLQFFEPKKNKYPPVVSVARSPLKENEDFLVGQSVFFSADSLMRTGGTLIQYTKCSVFGYGKIGRSVAHHLLQRGIKPNVYDVKSLLRIKAFNEMCSIPTRDWIIENSDAIFCATGSKCLELDDFRRLKNGCFIFSVTSSDDEMDLSALNGEYTKTKVKEHIYKFSSEKNFFFLANEGNAVNFIHNAVMGSFIHLVRAEMICATRDDSLEIHDDGLQRVTASVREEIAKIWLDVIDPEYRGISSIEYIL